MEKIRVALADDHTIVRKGIASMLNDDPDFEVVADAPNGRELINQLRAVKAEAQAQVCLLDINMPEMDGYETLKALRKEYPEMKFLALTQLRHELVVIRMLKNGASGYLLKDVEPADLKTAIRTVLTEKYYHNRLVDGRLFAIATKDQNADFHLTARETKFLRLCCTELPYTSIAKEMAVAYSTVAFYRQALFTRLNVNSRMGLALYALKLGLDN